ncbi:MAG TPA: DUF6402 family protein [Pyrinomonadaceae bacterium]|nr:DUF6402 family protein [Pyrinomonadaceae bacterium]
MMFQVATYRRRSSRCTRIARALVVLLAILISYSSTHAQAEDSCKYCKPKVVIAFNGAFCSSGHFKLYINGTLLLNGTAACDAATYNRSNIALAGLVQDVTYQFQVTGACATHLNFFQVPEGYYIEVDGKERKTIDKGGAGLGDGDGIWNVVLRKRCKCGEESAGESRGTKLGSIMWDVGLGGLSDGRSAGNISIHAESLAAFHSTPAGLIYSPPGYTNEIDVIKNPDNSFRQIKSPATLADIVVTNTEEYEIRFYKHSDVGPKDQNGLYTFSNNPFVTWRVRNPNPGTVSQLEISKIQNAVTQTNLYTWNSAALTWSLTTGNGARTETKVVTFAPGTGDRTETFTVTNASSQVISKIARTYHQFSWPGQELIREVVDPGGAALTTTYDYYTVASEVGRFIRLKSITHPDGSWEKYDYDTIGNRVLVLRPWKDLSLATATEANSRAIRTTYSNYDGFETALDAKFVSSIEEKVAGATIRKTTYSRTGTTVNGEPAVAESETVYASATASLTTITTRYHLSASDFLTGRVASIQYPDGRLDTYTYGKGNYVTNADPSLNEFIPDANGLAQRDTVVHGTVAAPDGIAFKTTKDTTIRDQFGKVGLTEVQAYTGSGYSRVSWSVMDYDERGHLIQTRRSNGTVVTAAWEGDLKTADVDENGIETTYTYDALNRIATRTRKGVAAAFGFPSQADIVTTYGYDAEGHITSETTSAAGLTLTQSRTYDVAGRVKTETDRAGLLTTHTYTNGGRTETTTLPGGATRVTDNYLDGQTKSILGTATVIQFFDYGVNGDSTPYVQEFIGSAGASSPRWLKTSRDWMGRTIKVETPGFTPGSTVLKLSAYNALGQLQTESVMSGANKLKADIIFEYDGLGNRIRAGSDIDGSGTLTLASTDRITDFDQMFQQNGSDWFKVIETKTYLLNGNPTPIIVSTQKERLSNFTVNGGEKTISDITTTDVANNQTRNTIVVDRAAKKMTARGDVPNSATDAVSVTFNGRLQTSTPAAAVSASTFTYDALGRSIGVSDPATGNRTQGYDATTGQLVSESQGAQTTNFEYFAPSDPNAGKLRSQTNPAGKKVYFNYNSRGEIVQTWGDTAYPVEYVYDAYGQQTEMHTFRNGTGWQGNAWPAATPGQMDITRWAFHDATGLLTSKSDAANKQVSYTYDLLGRMATRTWARLNGGNPVVTTYSYDPNSGEMTGVGYSDGTPPVTLSYDRGGRRATITDAAGTHTITHNDAGQLLSDSISGGLLDQVSVTIGYDSLLRRSSLQGTRNTTSLLSQTYGYDASSRLETVSSGSQTVTYGFYPGTGLLNTTTFTGNTQLSRTYDSLGRLETIAASTAPSGTIASYAYTHNNLDQRTRATREDNSYWSYGYDDRGELTSAKKYWSDNSPVAGQQTEYVLDAIGNRTSTKAGGDAQGLNQRQATYSVNSLNQYQQRTVPGALDVLGTANAAATVTVNDQATYRRGDYFYKELTVDNVSAPAYPQVKAVGVRSGAGGAGEDAVTQTTGHIYVPKNIEVYTYDDDGNLTSDGRWNYTWDAENHLSSMETIAAAPVAAKLRLEFAYDYVGRRIQKKVYVWNVPASSYQLQSTTRFVYDDWNLIAELDAAGNLVRNYVWSSEVLLIGTGTDVYQTSYDGNQNITGLIQASSGLAAASYDYDAFGRILKSSGEYAGQNPLRFSGKYTDSETGLLYYGYRYYNPDTGRWIGRDPIGENGGNHLYRFVNNDGVNRADYLGLIEVDQIADIMHQKGWLNGEVLLRHWMAGSANPNPAIGLPDTTTIRMDSWVLTFARAKEVFDRIFTDKAFVNEPAQKQIIALLQRYGKFGDYWKYNDFDFVTLPAIDVDRNNLYINERYVGSQWDEPDDMVAALARFRLRMSIKGAVCGARVVYINEVGVYAMDSYDFNDDAVSKLRPGTWVSQPLGFWNPKTGRVGRTPPGDYVSNKTFQEYRSKTGRGSDFIVYSDIKITKLQTPEYFLGP